MDLADAVGPGLADHILNNDRDAAVELGRRRRVISLNPFRPNGTVPQRREAVRVFLQAASHVLRDKLAPTASGLVEMALDEAGTLVAPSPLLAMEVMTDPGLRSRAFRQQRDGKRRRMWRSALGEPAVFSSAIGWLGRCIDALQRHGVAERLAPVKRAVRLARIIQDSRITYVVVPEHQSGMGGRLALMELVSLHIEEGFASDGTTPEPGIDPPCLVVTGASGKELDLLARTLHVLRSAGCPLCLECGRVLRCDGRSLRLLGSLVGAAADRRDLPVSHPLVHAGLIPQRKRHNDRKKKDRRVFYFPARSRRGLEVRLPPMPANRLGYSRLLRETGVGRGAEISTCAEAVNRCRRESDLRSRRRASASVLDQAFTVEGLEQGFHRVRHAGGGAGSDGVTPDDYEADLPRRLSRLTSQIHSGRYRPRVLNRVRQAKRSGGHRTLQIAVIRDRVAQSALAMLLSRLVEPTLRPSVYGYRQGVGVHTAVAAARQARARGSLHAIKTDIADCYDSVDHNVLWPRLSAMAPHETALRLLQQWMGQWARAVNSGGRSVGISQGSPLSPVLLNLHLTPMDEQMERTGVNYFRYADDLLFLGRTPGDARRAMGTLERFLKARLRMRLKAKKTKGYLPGEPMEYLGIIIHGEMCRIPTTRMEDLKERIRKASETGDPVEERVERVNQLVEGFGNYYRVIGRGTEVDLGALDAWLETFLRRFCRREGIPIRAAASMFRRLGPPPARARGPVPTAVPYSTPRRPPPGSTGDPLALPGTLDLLEEYEDEPPPPPVAKTEGRFFSTAGAIREARRTEEHGPVLLQDGWLRVNGYGVYLTRSGEALLAKKKGEVIYEAPLASVDTVQVLSRGVTLSTYLLERIAGEGKVVLLSDPSGNAHGCVLPMPDGRSVRLHRIQARLLGTGEAHRLARGVVAAKLQNLRRLLLYYAKYRRRTAPEVCRRLESSVRKIEDYCARLDGAGPGPETAEIFAIEGGAARHYWTGVGDLLEGRVAFKGRNKRGARDLFNGMLNYGYAMLSGLLWRESLAAGLHPALGFLHTSRAGGVGLVYDLMEELRQPLVDRPLLSLILRGAKMAQNRRGDLTMRSRKLLVGSVESRLDRRVRRGGRSVTNRSLVRHQVRSFRGALLGDGAYRAYRMSW